MFTICLIVLSLAIQLGPSYYVSVASLMLILAVLNWSGIIFQGLLRSIPLMALTCFMSLQMLGLQSLDPGADILRAFREAVMFVILVSVIAGLQSAVHIPRAYPPLKSMAIVLGALLLLSLVQTVMLARGIYFGIPEDYFTLEAGTIPSELSLRYTAESLRPAGTFAEPSYLGFMLLSFALMLVPRAGQSRWVNLLLVVIIMTGLLSRSLAFFLSLILVVVLPLLFERNRNRVGIIVGIVVAAVPILLFTNAGLLVTRLLEAGSSGTADYSTGVRIYSPLVALAPYLLEFPAGAPYSVVERAVALFNPGGILEAAEIMQNGVFNLAFSYGVIGLALMVAILWAAKDNRVRLYLFSCAIYNGAFLAIDKIAMITLTLAIYECGKRANAEFATGRFAMRAQRDGVRPLVDTAFQKASRAPSRFR